MDPIYEESVTDDNEYPSQLQSNTNRLFITTQQSSSTLLSSSDTQELPELDLTISVILVPSNPFRGCLLHSLPYHFLFLIQSLLSSPGLFKLYRQGLFLLRSHTFYGLSLSSPSHSWLWPVTQTNKSFWGWQFPLQRSCGFDPMDTNSTRSSFFPSKTPDIFSTNRVISFSAFRSKDFI